MGTEVSVDLFNKVSEDVDELKKAFHLHETEFSKFTGSTDEWRISVVDKLDMILTHNQKKDDESAAVYQLIQSLNDRVNAIEIQRQTEKEAHTLELLKHEKKTNIYIGIGVILATAFPYLLKLIGV